MDSIEPLLSHQNTLPRPQSLLSLPEDDEISIPISISPPPTTPLTPSQLKHHLIFGHHQPDTTTFPPSPPPPDLLESSSYNYNKSNTSSKAAAACLHRSKTAPAISVTDDLNCHHPSSPPDSPNRSPSVIRQAVLLLCIYLSLGVIIYWFNRDSFSANETNPIVDAVYFCIVTMCTIGYGDITPTSTVTKLFSILFVLVGFGFIDILLSGMVGYVLDLQESYMLNAVKQRNEAKKKSGSRGAGSYIIDVKKGRMRIRIKVALALGVVVLCICVGALVMHLLERLGWLDSFYLSVMSVTTVGYGDRTFNSMEGRAFASVWLLVSTLAVARAFLYLAEARVDKRQRRMAKWVLGHDMTVAEFLAADLDNNGFVRYFFGFLCPNSKSLYIYMRTI